MLETVWQKRQYRKQARQTARAGAAKAAKQTAAATEKAGAQAVGFIKRHPVGVLLALACVLLLFIMQSCSSSLVMFGNSGAGAVGATTYLKGRGHPGGGGGLCGYGGGASKLPGHLREHPRL